MTLSERWRETWRMLGAPPDDALLESLRDRYSEPHRRYHTLQHLEECFDAYGGARETAERPGEVELALWFHDAIYDVHRRDNEARSAAWARGSVEAAGLEAGVGERAYALVMATRHDAAPSTPDAKLVVDVDLSILGADALRFDEYESQVREEYAWVPEAVFRRERRRILEGFLGRPRIYLTRYFHATHEARARFNLQRSIAAM
jgi:predicted metal-dependent HD superfamily phosphohydrolase